NASGARRARKRSSGESPWEGQTLKRKATDTEEEDDQSEKKYRKCEKAGCSAMYPVCFASASERCAKNGYTSRWYHLSCGEHFCNECFDHYYRSHKDGYETFAEWKKVWTSNGKSEPSLKAFMADQQLPFWVQCTKPDCRKWRQLTKEAQLTPALAETYRCGMKYNNIKSEGPDQCSQPEDLKVLTVEKCSQHIIVRGLVRVRCVQELDRVLHFMTRKGLINTGVLRVERPLLPEGYRSVIPLKSRDRIGGRVWDDTSLGVMVGRGAQIVNGCVNNPIALMCEQVSARSWDHNEFFAQFSGDHTLLTKGYYVLLHKLAEGLDICTNCPVQAIDYSGETVKVISSNGSQWTAQKVLVTVPLILLQKNLIHFNPPLPERKLKAIHSLGAGIIEKIALQFPCRFWDKKIQGADYFGNIPPVPEKRGMFSVFYDLDPQGKNAVLMSVISGDAVAAVQDMEEKDVVNECMKVLRELFKEQEVPEPVNYFVTHWSKDVWSQMSYSFVKTGGSGEAYDILAEDVQGKVFFAGEATNRHFPQTVTGAYLSGVREASKMTAV
uniref:Lysine demethylase 1B n=1 Tax=Oryzias latipes TaxID=8090 RepID=A0A3P9H3I8_ORYLA